MPISNVRRSGLALAALAPGVGVAAPAMSDSHGAKPRPLIKRARRSATSTRKAALAVNAATRPS